MWPKYAAKCLEFDNVVRMIARQETNDICEIIIKCYELKS